MAVKVRFRQAALDDLFGLYAYIAEQSGRERAASYIDRLEATCLRRGDFPERGTRRDDLRPGLRTLGYQRQASVVFRIDDAGAEIGRILYGGRDVEALSVDPYEAATLGAD